MKAAYFAVLLIGAFHGAASLARDPPRPVPPVAVSRVPVALLVDLSSGQTLYARNPDKPFLPASVTKAMTALVAFDLIKQGKLTEETPVVVSPETALSWSGRGSSLSLRAGERLRFGEVLLGTTAASANDGAIALAEAGAGSTGRFVALMNARATRLGMRGSRFGTPNGYPDQGRTVVNAQDLALLARALVSEHPALYRRYFGRPAMIWRGRELRNHDPITGTVPGADGIKTGHTLEAGYNFLGSAERDGRRLVLVIGGARTETDRANAARALIEWGFSDWSSTLVAPPGWIAGRARVQQGTRRNVPLVLPLGARIALPRGRAPAFVARIRYRGPLLAPIAKGSEIARLEFTADGIPAWSIPLVAGEAVGRAGAFDRIVNGLLGITG